jgi:predicted phage-related endonuclease
MMKLDLEAKNLGCKLPSELAHLERFSMYAKLIKEDVYAFFIPQFFEDGKPNLDWWEFRKRTIGSSEAATLTGHDEYGDPVKLFWSKVGMDFPFVNTKFTIIGLHLEEKISDLWEYFDGTDDGYVDNWHKGEKVREKKDIPCYAVNINYPHISASLDFYVPAGQASPFTGEIIDFDFPLEIKTVSQFASDKYELGIPEKYVRQLQLQMFVFGATYAEIAYLIAGFDFKCLPVDLDVDICREIIEKSYEFTEIVNQARDLYDGYDLLPESEQREIDLQISKLEPEPSGNDAYMEFYKAKYRNSYEDTLRLGTEEEWDICVEYKTLGDTIKELEKRKKELQHKIKSFSALDETISFEENGRVINKRREGKRDIFNVNIKNYK